MGGLNHVCVHSKARLTPIQRASGSVDLRIGIFSCVSYLEILHRIGLDTPTSNHRLALVQLDKFKHAQE